MRRCTIITMGSAESKQTIISFAKMYMLTEVKEHKQEHICRVTAAL